MTPTFLAVLALSALATQDPASRSASRVADQGGRLAPATAAALNAELAAVEHATGVRLTVVVWDSLAGLEPRAFADTLLASVGTGPRGRDFSALLLWSPGRRAVEIVTGAGLRLALPDARLVEVRDGMIYAAFRRGAFDEGMLEGVRALTASLRTHPGLARGWTPAAAGDAATGPAGRRGATGLLWQLPLALTALAAAWTGRRWLRRRPRPCPAGHGRMSRVPEADDDAFLEEAERLEEKLRSVDYDVWRCGECGALRKIAYRRWLSGYHRCPECKRRTVSVRSETVRRATAQEEGSERVTETCHSCRKSWTWYATTARVGSGSTSGAGSSGGSGGSAFGGGSAGGGGAGGRY